MVKPASTWEISLIYYQSRIMRNKSNKNNFLYSFLLHRLNITPSFHYALPRSGARGLGTAITSSYIFTVPSSSGEDLLTLLHCSSMGSLPCWKTALHELLQCESFHWAAIPYEFSTSLSIGCSSSGADCSIVGLLQGHRSCH